MAPDGLLIKKKAPQVGASAYLNDLILFLENALMGRRTESAEFLHRARTEGFDGFVHVASAPLSEYMCT